MNVYRPTYRDPKSGKRVHSKIWWIQFVISGRPVRESTHTTRKGIAQDYENNRRLELERGLAGIPSTPAVERIASVKQRVEAYQLNYGLNHRAKSVRFSTQRLKHVTRLLGRCSLVDLTEDKIFEYIRTRAGEKAGGRTINMEIGELSRALKVKWAVAWPHVRKLEENHDIGVALSPEEEARLLQAAANDRAANRNPSLYAILRVALLTGMREGELFDLQWQSVDWREGTVTVGKAKTRLRLGLAIDA